MIGIGGARASLTREGRSGTHGSRGATSVLADGGRHPHTRCPTLTGRWQPTVWRRFRSFSKMKKSLLLASFFLYTIYNRILRIYYHV